MTTKRSTPAKPSCETASTTTASACTPTSVSDCGACGRTCATTVLVINEIMIKLVNLSGWDVDLRGFVISDLGSDTHTITSANPVIIADGGYAILGNNADSFTNGGIAVDYQYAGTALDNSGDEIVITAHGVELDRVEWNTTFDPIGSSKELSINHQNAADNDTLGNWCTAVSVLPSGDNATPGAANDCSL